MESYVSSSGAYISYLVKSLAFIVCLLACFFYWHTCWLPKIQSSNASNLRLRERLVVEPGTAVYILEIRGAYKLLIVSNKQTALTELDGKKLQYPAAGVVAEKKDFAEYLGELTKPQKWFKPNKTGKEKTHARK